LQFLSGTCVTDFNEFKCLCQNLYTGSTCLEIIDTNTVCASSPCSKTQQCVPLDPTNYICACPINYTGRFCDIRIRNCDSQPCLRGGICLENFAHNTYTCQCPVGSTGPQCELDIDVCASNPCNSGTCLMNRTNNFNCNCPPGVTGLYCQIDLDECLSI
jgi:Notch-like protein